VSPAAPVAIVSCRQAIDEALDEDEPLLLSALARHGVEAEVLAWDDPAARWERFELVVVRSTWDYPPRRDEYVTWADLVRTQTVLANPAPVLRWNTDKRYLDDLAAWDVPVVPTTFLVPGDTVDLGPGGVELVVKPAVSGGSQDTARYVPDERAAAERHAEHLLAQGRVVMVQPYLARIDEHGETALVFIDGVLSHAMRKGPLLEPGAAPVDALFAAEQMSVREPSAAEVDVARQVLDALGTLPDGGSILYARIDLLPGPDGGPVVLEVELTEPSLFLAHLPEAADRLASAIVARLPSRPS
jgi:glutathione synthase/RimK-type ligase-like ATP-grasp enzyme